MNKKILIVSLGCLINLYVDLNSVVSGSPRSPRPPMIGDIDNIDERVAGTPTLFDKLKDMEPSFVKRSRPVENIDPSKLSTLPQSPLTSRPRVHPFQGLDEMTSVSPFGEITRKTSFSERMADRAKQSKEASSKTAERLVAEEEAKIQNSQESKKSVINEPPLKREFYPDIIIPGEITKVEEQVQEPLTPKGDQIGNWWGETSYNVRGKSQVDQIRKLQKQKDAFGGPAQRIGQTPGPLDLNPSLSQMKEEDKERSFALSGISNLLRKKVKQNNLSAQANQNNKSSTKNNSNPNGSSVKSPKKKALPKKPIKPEYFKKNFGQAFLGKFNEEFELQGGKEYGAAIEILRRMATKDEFAAETPSVKGAQERLNEANKAFVSAVNAVANPTKDYIINDGIYSLSNKTNLSEDDVEILLTYSRLINQKIIEARADAQQALEKARKQVADAYVQEAKNDFLESFPDTENVKKALVNAEMDPENGFLAKAVATMQNLSFSEKSKQNMNALLGKNRLTDEDREFISMVLGEKDKVEFDRLRNAVAQAKGVNTQKLDNLLSFVPAQTLDKTMIDDMRIKNDQRGAIYGTKILPKKQKIKKPKQILTPESPKLDS